MVRRYLSLAAMLLLMASLMVGVVGTASAQDPVHEADGTWHKSDDDTVRFNVTWKGKVNVRWKNWLADEGYLPCSARPPDSDVDCVADGDEPDAPVPVDRWKVTATTSGEDDRNKNSPRFREVRFGNLTFGKDYTVKVEGFDADDASLGSKEFTIRPRHVSPPDPVTGLTLEIGDDNLSVEAEWTAPAAGGTPRRYDVYLTNLDSGRARWHSVDAGRRNGGWKQPKTETSFEGLWPGDTYRVSVQVRNRNSRASGPEVYTNSWQGSSWVSATVTMPSGPDPSYEKKVPTLIWFGYYGGEPAPPYAVAGPTAYVVIDNTVPGGRAWFDYPNKCLEYMDHYGKVHALGTKDGPASDSVIAADKARKQARGQVQIMDRERGYRDAAVAAKQEYLDGTPDSERDPAKIAGFDQKITRHQNNIDAGEVILDGKEQTVAAKCAVAYPAVENLTGADDRFYRIAQTQEAE